MTRIGLHKTPTVGTASRLLRLGLDYGPTGENNGNIRTMTVAAGNTNPLFSATQTYEYDAVNRLKSAAEVTAWKQTFGYDRFGNRWIEAGANTFGIDSRGAATGLASYVGSTNRLSGVPHDWAGNASPAGLALTYDVENRVVKMVTNGAESLYEYDGEGRRVMKVSGGVTTTYVYDAAGQLAAEYATGGSEVGETGRRYLFADHLGSTRLRTAQDGTVVGWWDYAPFGEEVPGTAGGRSGVSGVPYGGTYAKVRFGGKERDVEGATSSSLGLDYFGARYMSAAQGRFTSPDAPFADQHPEDPQSWNLYSYGRNSPLVLVDKDGNAVMLATALAGAAFGGGARAFSNYMSGRPLLENVGRDALIGGAAGATGVGLLNVARNSATIMTAASAVSGFVLSRPGLIQRTGELVADAVAPPGTPSFSSGIGAFAQVAESMSARSAIYQSKITGTLPDATLLAASSSTDSRMACSWMQKLAFRSSSRTDHSSLGSKGRMI